MNSNDARLEEIKRITDASKHHREVDLTGATPYVAPSNERFVPESVRNPKINIPISAETPDVRRLPVVDNIDDLVFGNTPGTDANTVASDNTIPMADQPLAADPFDIPNPVDREQKIKEIMANNVTRENAPVFKAESGGATPTEMTEVNVSDFVPLRVPKAEELLMDDNDLFNQLDEAVARTNRETTELHKSILEMQYREASDLESGVIPEYLKDTDLSSKFSKSDTEETSSKEDEEEDEFNYTPMQIDTDQRISILDEIEKSDEVEIVETPIVNQDDCVQTNTSLDVDVSDFGDVEMTEEVEVVEKVEVEEVKVVQPEIEIPISVRTVELPSTPISKDIDENDDLSDILGDETSDPDDAAIRYENMSDEERKEAADRVVANMKNSVAEKIRPVNNVIDITKFTISKTPIDVTAAMQLPNQKAKVADWILYSAGRSISMSALSGPDIITLGSEGSGRNAANASRDMWRVFYDHLVDANKPSFESWLKLIRYADIEHIFFNAYMATFHDSNYMQFICPKCSHVFLKDFKFNDMIKYKDDEVKSRVVQILSKDSTSPCHSYETEIYQVSDRYVVSLKEPSVWNAIIELASLSDTIRNKYQSILDVLIYIDAFYIINHTTQQLQPIAMHEDPNDYVKTYGRRIKICADMLRSLTPDEFSALSAKINKMEIRQSDVTYIRPGCDCPKCSFHIDEATAEQDVSAMSILFTRHRLGTFGHI